MISVIIPTYNRESTIEKAIRSILQQTYQDIEVIVVDDCSSDNTEEVVKAISDSRIIYHRLSKNSGACVARNTGVELAHGNIVAFQDSDDIWHFDKLEKQLAFLKDNSYEFISCSFNRVTEQDSIEVGKIEFPKDRIELWCKLLNSNWVSTQTIVCYRYCFKKIAFDPAVKRYQDWDLALSAACYFKVGHLNESLVDVYLQENSITNTVKSEQAKQFIVNKHKSDVDFSNKKMAAQYYKTGVLINLWFYRSNIFML